MPTPGYRSLRLCYFSGTGNTYRLACWMCGAAQARGIEAAAQPVSGGPPEPAPDGLLGILCPAHGFTAPWSVIRFALSLPWGRGAHAFAAVSRGGSRLGPWLVPGMEGTAAYLIALILLLKGYSVRGARGIDTPTNWLQLHPGLKPATATRLMERARRQALPFFEAILEGRRRFRSLIPLALGIALAPISFAYLITGRFLLAKVFFATARCNGCEICAKGCPHQAIRMHRGRPYWTFDCESCMRCMAYCPSQAIEAGHSVAVLLVYCATLAKGVFLGHLLAQLPWLRWFDHWIGWTILGWPAAMAAFWLAYLAIHRLSYLGPVNRLLRYTTLTTLYRRSHELGTKITDLAPVSGRGRASDADHRAG